MLKRQSIYILSVIGLVAMAILASMHTTPVQAKTSITVSPLYQNKVLTAGEKESGSFIIANPATNDETLEYEIEVSPFWVDDENNVDFIAHEDYSQMVDWITIEKPTGSIKPNEDREITFIIEVPDDAPAGGQYASINVKSVPKQEGMITETFGMAHLVYAEVAGKTTRGGEITNLSLPGFMLSGNIAGGASVKNDGNVHAKAYHTMKIYPFIGSNEELFTNEEIPQENVIMPGSTRYTSVSWDETPSVGIFRANYTVEFEGVKKELSKIIVVCPLWLLIIMAIIVATIIYRIVSGIISSKEKKE